MATDFEEYKNTPGAIYSESKFYDSLGREMEAQKCEFCQKRKPVRVWLGPDFSTSLGRDNYHVMMYQYRSIDGEIHWLCNDCNTDMKMQK